MKNRLLKFLKLTPEDRARRIMLRFEHAASDYLALHGWRRNPLDHQKFILDRSYGPGKGRLIFSMAEAIAHVGTFWRERKKP